MKLASLSVALAALALLVALRGPRVRDSVRTDAAPARSATALGAACPEGTLPDEGVCIPVPAPVVAGRAVSTGDRIPRRPDRDADYGRYELPASGLTVVARETALAGNTAGSAGALAVFFRTEPGAAIRAISLEDETAPPVVVFDADFVGRTVCTVHETASRERPRRYLVLIGNLGDGARLAPGTPLPAGTRLGVASGAPLYLEVRWLTGDASPLGVSPTALVSSDHSVPVDPRNVLRPRH